MKKSKRITSSIFNTRFIAALFLGIILIPTYVSRAADSLIRLPIIVVNDSANFSFNSLVFVDRPFPEWVYFSGDLAVITAVQGPFNGCAPGSPCSLTGTIAEFTPGTITGIGVTRGLTYQLAGKLAVKRTLQIPGSTVVQPQFTLVPPLRFIRLLTRPVPTVTVPTVITFDANGRILRAAAPPIPLASWWQAEGTAADALGVNPGTISATEPVAFVPGIVGQAFRFSNQGFVEVTGSPSLEPANVSVAAWVRGDVSPGNFAHILAKGAFACEGASYALYTGANGGLQFYVSDGVTFSISPDAGPTVWDGNWHLAVGTFDGTTVRLYVDGVEMGAGTPAPVTINYAAPNRNFYIGAYRGSCELRFNGDVDDVQIFRRALIPAEVEALFKGE